jgi:signal transduction histidine kinase
MQAPAPTQPVPTPPALNQLATSPALLLIAPDSAAQPIAEALRNDLHAEVETTPSRRAALSSLRRNDFALILIDESLATSDSASIDLIYQNAGGALVLELNLALSSAARIVRQARSALARRAQDLATAHTAAAAALHSELNTTLAGILLESQLALREAAPAQAPRLRHLVQLASDLRDRLRA